MTVNARFSASLAVAVRYDVSKSTEAYVRYSKHLVGEETMTLMGLPLAFLTLLTAIDTVSGPNPGRSPRRG